MCSSDLQVNDKGNLEEESFQEILGKIGLSVPEISELLYQNLSNEELKNGLGDKFFINNNGDAASMTIEKLDRINRFVRLAKKLNWSFTDLDWVLKSLNSTEINTETITQIAKIKQAQTKYKLTLDVLSSFWYDMKTVGQKDAPKSQPLFDRIFNNPHIAKTEAQIYHPTYPENPLYTDSVSSWKIAQATDSETTQNQEFSQTRLITALKINENQLVEIAEAIWGEDAEVDLTVENLSLLFRTTKILKLLRLSLEDYQILLKLNDSDINQPSLDKFIQLTSLNEWLKTSGLKPAELDYIVNQTRNQSIEKYYSHLNWDNLETGIRNFVEDLWFLSTPLLITPASLLNDEIEITQPTASHIFDRLVEIGQIKLVSQQPFPSQFGSAATTVGSLIVFAGGHDQYLTDQGSNTVDIYDAHEKEWLTPKNAGQLSQSRLGGAATSVGTLAIFAGGYNSDEEDTDGEVIDIFDAISKTWSTQPIEETTQERSLKQRSSIGATSVGNLAIFAGGYSHLLYCRTDAVNIYDGSQKTWLKEPGKLSQARSALAATTVGNLAIFAGGFSDEGFSDVVDIYNRDGQEGKKWTASNKLSVARDQIAATTVGNLAIFAGGWNQDGYSDVVDIYDVSTKQWVTKQLSQPRGNLAATSVGNLAIFAGGYGEQGWSDVVDIYDATTGTWLPHQNLSEPRSSLVAASAGNMVIFAGGYNQNRWSKTVEIYDVLTNTIIRPIHQLSQPRSDLAATVTSLQSTPQIGIV